MQPEEITPDIGNAAILARAKAALERAAPQMTLTGTRCFIIPGWAFDLMSERYSMTWPDDYFREIEVREEVREEMAKLAEANGAPELAEKIRSTRPNYPAIG